MSSSLMNLSIFVRVIAVVLLAEGLAFGVPVEESMTQLAHASWGTKEGIANVEALAQTSDGYLWVGTHEGLFRFDGLSFTRWQPGPDKKSPSLSAPVLCAGSDGSLWIGSGSGVSRLQKGDLTRFSSGGEVTSILEDHTGAVWVGTTKGLTRFTAGDWLTFDKSNGLMGGNVRVELEDRKGSLWIAVDDPAVAGGTRLAFLRRGAHQFEVTSDHLGSVAMVCEAPDGQLWVSETSGLVRPLLMENGKVQSQGFALQSRAACFDRDGAFWITTLGKGVYRIRGFSSAKLGADELKQSGNHFTEKEGLSSDFITCALEDLEGNLWFGTAGGLDRFRGNKVSSVSVREGLNYDQRLMVTASDNGAVWAGSEQGLQRIDRQKVETVGFEWIGPGWVNGVYSFYSEPSGDTWVAALNGVGHIKGSLHEPVEIDGGMEFHNVTAMTRDQAGGLWLCDQLRGVCRLAHDKPRIFPASRRLSSATANAAITDSQGRVWLGFQDGSLSVYKDGEFHVFWVPQAAMALLCDKKGQIWVAGQGGLSRFGEVRFDTLTSLNGLPSTELSAILEDDNGLFWIAGHSAIFSVDPQELEKAFADSAYRIQCSVYDASDGLRGFPRQSRPFPVAAKASDHRLWFATTAGLAVIDPQHIRNNTNPPPVQIVQAIVDGKETEPTEDFELPAGTKDIKIDYTALSFVAPEKVRFRCKLEGYEHDWDDVKALRQASYRNLRPGKYCFNVIGCNNDGVWASKGATWAFSIRPSFYQTTWFLLIAFGGTVLAFWGTYHWHLARVTAQTEARMNVRMEAQMDERKRIAQELHDTLLQGFTGVRLKIWAITHQIPENLTATREQLNNVIRQTDQCLAESRRSVWALRSPRLEESDGLTTALSQATEQLVSGTRLQLEFKTIGQPRKLAGIVEYNLLRICEEAVANAIKHAEAQKVTVEIHFEDAKVTLRISDDGHGFDLESPEISRPGHFGLAGMRERAKIVGGGVDIKSKPGEHTKITVTIAG